MGWVGKRFWKGVFREQDHSFWRVLRIGKAGGNWNEVTPGLHQKNVYFEKIVAGLAFLKGEKKGANMDAYLFAGCYVISGLSNGGRGREARTSGHTLRKAFCKKKQGGFHVWALVGWQKCQAATRIFFWWCAGMTQEWLPAACGRGKTLTKAISPEDGWKPAVSETSEAEHY